MRWRARLSALLRRVPSLPTLSEAEADAVLLGLHLVIRRGDADAVAGAQSVLTIMAAALPEESGEATQAGLPAGPPTGDPDDTLARVRGALEARCKLRLLYRDGDRQWSRRVVWPLALRLDHRAAILAAWCETRADFRHFRLDRIEHAEPLAERLPAAHRVLVAQYRAGELARD